MDTAFAIGMEYAIQFRRKYRRTLCGIKNLRTNKWWAQFEKAASYVSNEDAKGFIQFLFTQDYEEVMYPFILISKKTRELYKDYKSLKTKPVSNSSASINVIMTIRGILTWCKKNNVEENRMKHFFADRANAMKIENKTLYEPVFYFSRIYLENKHIQDIDLKRMVFKNNNPKEYEAIKKIFGSDFV